MVKRAILSAAATLFFAAYAQAITIDVTDFIADGTRDGFNGFE